MRFLSVQRWFSWTRLACLLGTAILLWLVFRRVDGAALAEALRRVHPGGVVFAFGLYGVAIMASAVRWHVALRATERVVHFLATWRLSLAGHFLFTVFFGVVGGDGIKAVLYSKWFRLPFSGVLAAAPLDRGLSVAGGLVLALVAAAATLAGGGAEPLRQIEFSPAGLWMVAGVAVPGLAALMLLRRRMQRDTWLNRWIDALFSGGRRLVTRGRLAGAGLAAGLASQVALSAVFALCLAAVAEGDVPWLKLAWAFPAITALSGLPFTVAGAGVREAAALTFLGFYGVPVADCVAASMLTMLLKLLWAGVGGAVLWREQALQESRVEWKPATRVTIVIPALNESASLPETVRRARANPEVGEIIVVDGGSDDDTRGVAESLGCRIVTSPRGRGQQMRAGVARASADVLMFLHADTWLPPGAARAALDCLRDRSVVGGGFWKVYHDGSWLLRGSRLKCALRLYLRGWILGDQVLFVRRDALEKIGGVPELELMEEFELCRRLRVVGRLSLAGATVSTSARRFNRVGVFRLACRTWWLGLRLRRGAAPGELTRAYEKE